MTDDNVPLPSGALTMLEELVPQHLRTGKQTYFRERYEGIRAFIEHVAAYEEVLADHHRLVRELDVLLHGDDAARQASLCDLIGIVRARRETALELANKLEELGVTLPGWQKNAYHYFPHTSGKVPLYAVETFFDRAVNLAERVATFLKAGYRR